MASKSSSVSMQELIRQRVGLSLASKQPPTTALDADDSDQDDGGSSNYVCKCCRKCDEFVPKRTEISKGPKANNNNNSSNSNNRNQWKGNGRNNNQNNKGGGKFNGKRTFNQRVEEEEDNEEEEEENTGSICATCGCTLIHHLVDDWEADNDERDEDYLAEYGDYDD